MFRDERVNRNLLLGVLNILVLFWRVLDGSPAWGKSAVSRRVFVENSEKATTGKKRV